MDLSDDCLAALVRLYKVACVTALSEMVGMDGTPNDNQLDASIEAGVRAVAEAVTKGLGTGPHAVPSDDAVVASFIYRAASVICRKSFPSGPALVKAREIADLALTMLSAPPIDAPDSKR